MTGNLTKNVRVVVTQDHIDAGVRHASSDCMMALAVKDALDKIGAKVTNIRVFAGHVLGEQNISDIVARDEQTIGTIVKTVAWVLTDTAAKRIKQFDRMDTVKPFVTIIRGA